MENNIRKRKKHKKKWTDKFKKFFDKIFYSAESSPKEYRPFLGTDVDTQNEENGGFIDGSTTKKSHRKHRTKKKKSSPFAGITSMVTRWNKYKEGRKKHKHKSKIKRKHQKKKTKEARVALIRKFLPNYKKKSIVSFEFSQEEHQDDTDKDKQKIKGYLPYTANSTAYFLITYLIIYMLYQITVLVAASHWKLDSVLLYYDLAFNDYSPLWNRPNILFVTFSGPFISLVLGVLFFKVFTNRGKLSKSAKLFMLWLGLHGYNLFLGAFATGISFDEGFGYVPAWLFLNVFWQIFIALVFLFILGMISYYSAPKFLDTSYSPTRIRQQNKVKFLFFQVVLPWVIGAIIIFLVKIPNNMPYESGNLVTLVFATIPVLFNRHAKPTKNFKTEKKASRVSILLIVIAVLALAVYRIGLNNGLHIKLFYDFLFNIDITPL